MVKILDYLKGVKTHPSAEKIYSSVKKDIPSITLATVYRNLYKLEGQGLVSRFQAGGETRFDAEERTHQHFVCRKCGKISDVFNEDISENALSSARKTINADSVEVTFKGLCTQCSK